MRCETRISPITCGQSANTPYTRQSRTPTIRSERSEQATPIRAMTQFAALAGSAVNGETRNAASGGQMRLWPYSSGASGPGKGFVQWRRSFASG